MLVKILRTLLPLAVLLSTAGFAQEKYPWFRLDGANKIEENGMLFAKIRDYPDGKGLMWYTEFRPYFSAEPRKLAGDADLYKAIITIKPKANYNRERQAYLDFLNKHKVQDMKVNQLPGLSADGIFDTQKYQVCQLTESFRSLLYKGDAAFEPKQTVPAYPDLCNFTVYFFGDKLDEVKNLVAKTSASDIVKIRYSLPFCGEGSYVDRPLDSYLQKLVEVGALSKQGDDYVQDNAARFFFRSVQVLMADPNILRLDGANAEAKWVKFFDTFVRLENDGKSVRLDLVSHPEALEREVCVSSPFDYSNQQ